MISAIEKFLTDHHVAIATSAAIVSIVTAATTVIKASIPKGNILRGMLLYLVLQAIGLGLIILNDFYLWSFGLIILGIVFMISMPVYDFLTSKYSPIPRLEIVMYLLLPTLVCVFIIAAYVPSFVIRTNQNRNNSKIVEAQRLP